MRDPTVRCGKSTTRGDLVLLTAALDEPGTDVYDELTGFADNLAAAVPSLLGVTITVVLDGVTVTLSIHAADLAPTPHASLNIPFSELLPDVLDSTMMFYAADVSAFAGLPALVTRSAGGQGASLRFGHSLEVSGLPEFSVYNLAIGVLIDQGYTPDGARIELNRQRTCDDMTLDDMTLDDMTLDDTAQHTLDDLPMTTNRAEPARTRTKSTRLPGRRWRTGAAPGADLTARERDVLRLLVAGLSTAAIAAALLVLPGTVRDHLHSIMTKLGAESRVETVAITLSENVLGMG